MIYVEKHFLDSKTLMPISSVTKIFTSISEFNSFYKLAKEEPHTMINVLNYDPQKNPGQKSMFDVKLFSMSREIEL